MYTEEEANEKWCPFVRIHELPDDRKGRHMYAYNRPHNMQGMTCLGSKCMVWRKMKSKFRDARTGELSDRNMTGHGNWIEVGYCGLMEKVG